MPSDKSHAGRQHRRGAFQDGSLEGRDIGDHGLGLEVGGDQLQGLQGLVHGLAEKDQIGFLHGGGQGPDRAVDGPRGHGGAGALRLPVMAEDAVAGPERVQGPAEGQPVRPQADDGDGVCGVLKGSRPRCVVKVHELSC